MARYTGPVNKKMRFLGLEIPKKGVRSNRPPARRRLSAYGLQLREKQKARFLYGILEKQFRNY
jgi:small subunit ribosomal protein S4